MIFFILWFLFGFCFWARMIFKQWNEGMDIELADMIIVFSITILGPIVLLAPSFEWLVDNFKISGRKK
jgi:hypothetical protein